jgi:hypothetical protein
MVEMITRKMLMGPKHFGFDFDFIPIEKLQSK